jgi:hypothetical protein
MSFWPAHMCAGPGPIMIGPAGPRMRGPVAF